MRDHPLFSNRRNRGPARPEHTLVLLGFDNITALEDLFNEDIGTEVMDTAQARIVATIREADKVWRAGHRRIAVHAHGVNQKTSA